MASLDAVVLFDAVAVRDELRPKAAHERLPAPTGFRANRKRGYCVSPTKKRHRGRVAVGRRLYDFRDDRLLTSRFP